MKNSLYYLRRVTFFLISTVLICLIQILKMPYNAIPMLILWIVLWDWFEYRIKRYEEND